MRRARDGGSGGRVCLAKSLSKGPPPPRLQRFDHLGGVGWIGQPVRALKLGLPLHEGVDRLVVLGADLPLVIELQPQRQHHARLRMGGFPAVRLLDLSWGWSLLAGEIVQHHAQLAPVHGAQTLDAGQPEQIGPPDLILGQAGDLAPAHLHGLDQVGMRGFGGFTLRRAQQPLRISLQEERRVGNDNTVKWRNHSLQLPISPLRPHFVKAVVRVHEYPDGATAVFLGPHRLADYDAQGKIQGAIRSHIISQAA